MAAPRLHAARALDQPVIIGWEEALQTMQSAEMVEELGLLRGSTNFTFLVSLEREGSALLAVYKPRRGMRRLWDFPDGTLCKREVAAYLTSQALGWSLVPPTVLRGGLHGIGSVGIFIDHDPQQHYFTLDNAHYRRQLQRMAAFDVIVHSADRKGGHILLDADDRVWGVDNGLTFNEETTLRTVIWDFAGQALPADLLRDIAAFAARLEDPQDSVIRGIAQLLAPQEMDELRQRVHKLRLSGRFPRPGPGPNRPFPLL